LVLIQIITRVSENPAYVTQVLSEMHVKMMNGIVNWDLYLEAYEKNQTFQVEDGLPRLKWEWNDLASLKNALK
jgi:hypothetical protein